MRRTGLANFQIPWMMVALYLTAAATAYANEPASSRKIDFNYDIRPILSDKCFNCHGPDPRKRKAGLRLDTKDGAFARLKSDGHAIVPGNPDDSELVARITAEDEADRMPPKSLGRTLTPQEINLLKQWIKPGGRVEGSLGVHPARRGRASRCATFGLAPEMRSTTSCWPGSRRRGSPLAPEASKERLIRRVTL